VFVSGPRNPAPDIIEPYGERIAAEAAGLLQLLLEESWHHVRNPGPCVPAPVLAEACSRLRPDVLVLGTVNGHGTEDALAAIEHLRAPGAPVGMAVVIGGELSTSGRGRQDVERLLSAGFDAVFSDNPRVIRAFTSAFCALVGGKS
jgi:methylaspartate mutase sigma subunit